MSLREKLTELLNRESIDNDVNTPDFILAEYLTDCLATWDKTTKARDQWHGFVPLGEGGIMVGDGIVATDPKPAPPTQVVHILDAGLPVCEFTRKVPGDWPDGHRWVGLDLYWSGAAPFGEETDLLCKECGIKADAALKKPDAVTYTDDDLRALRERGAELEEFPRTGWCGAMVDGLHCGNPQFRTMGGEACREGHGGSPTLYVDPHA